MSHRKVAASGIGLKEEITAQELCMMYENTSDEKLKVMWGTEEGVITNLDVIHELRRKG